MCCTLLRISFLAYFLSFLFYFSVSMISLQALGWAEHIFNKENGLLIVVVLTWVFFFSFMDYILTLSLLSLSPFILLVQRLTDWRTRRNEKSQLVNWNWAVYCFTSDFKCGSFVSDCEMYQANVAHPPVVPVHVIIVILIPICYTRSLLPTTPRSPLLFTPRT